MEETENPSDSPGGGDDNDDDCDAEPSNTQAVGQDLGGTVPHVESEHEVPRSTAFVPPTHGNVPSTFLPSSIVQYPQYDASSRLCPSTIAASSTFALYGIRMSSYTTRHTDNIPSCFLYSLCPQRGLSNLTNNVSRLTQAVTLPNRPSGDSFPGQNNVPEDEGLLDQAEGGCDREKTPPASSSNTGEIDEIDVTELANLDDQGPVYLQESRSGDTFLDTRETSMFYPSATYNTFSDSLPGYNIGLNSLSIPSSSIGQSMQCVSADQSNHPIPRANNYSYSDNLNWRSCKICFIYKWKYVLIPCGHGLCGYCYSRIFNICPFCRKPILQKIKVLLSSNLVHDPGE